MTIKSFYTFVLILALVGWGWLIYHISSPQQEVGFSLCVFKHLTHLPCPACGTTRAIISLSEGNWYKALYTNPLGIIDTILLIATPIWLFIDLLFQQISLLKFYNACETLLKRPLIFISFCILILSNWIWNIYKGL